MSGGVTCFPHTPYWYTCQEEIFTEIARISSGYTVYQCVECAQAIKKWLKENEVSGTHLQLSATGRLKFIVSNRWKGGQESIAQTGIHQEIETQGKVFDNLAPTGLERANWLSDFDCASGDIEITEIESF